MLQDPGVKGRCNNPAQRTPALFPFLSPGTNLQLVVLDQPLRQQHPRLAQQFPGPRELFSPWDPPATRTSLLIYTAEGKETSQAGKRQPAAAQARGCDRARMLR